MKTFFVVVVLLAVAIALLIYLKKQGLLAGKGAGPWPFYIKKPLTQPEQVLYHRLVRALPDHIVLAQVQVSRVLGVKKGANYNEWQPDQSPELRLWATHLGRDSFMPNRVCRS